MLFRSLNKNNYYYTNNTEIFFYYNGKHYKTYKEDDILHEVLTTITQEENLMPWKHKIKLNLIKQVRENNLFKSIPESYTIQYVLNNIFPSIFSTRNEAKYFLTIIGDNILKKHDNLIYLINSNSKTIIKLIATAAYNYFGNSSILNNFKYKYHEQHNYCDCRLVNKINANSFFSSEFNANLLDLLCVAIYYSKRYNSADEYISQCGDIALINYSLYLSTNTPDIIVNNFIENSLQKSLPHSIPTQLARIQVKKMLYLWKLFLRDNNLPHILFLNTVKNILKDKIAYDETKETFLNVTSPQLPLISNFISFWDENMRDDEGDAELEIEEIISLFRYWNLSSQFKYTGQLNEGLLLELIKHFYSDIIIDEDKYILHIKCVFWNKNEKITDFLQEYKTHFAKKEEKYAISLNNLYTVYCKSAKKDICTIGKKNFEKCVKEQLKEFIDDENMISSNWWLDVNLG